MKDLLITLAYIATFLIGAYLFGRLFAKGVLKEIDLLLGKKFTEYINKRKQKDNGKKEKI